MSLRAYLIAMTLATMIAGATFALVLFRVDPRETHLFGFIIFYASLFLTIVGVISIVGFIVRVFLHRAALLSHLVALAFRQAILLALLAIAGLILQSAGLLNWWNGLIMVAVLTIVEFLFLSLERRPTHS